MEINAREVARLLELKKRKGDLELRKSLISVECEKELESVNSGMHELSRKAQSAGIEVIFPKQQRLDELGRRLKELPAEQIKDALKSREGEVYDILIERSRIIKENQENHLEIAKICMIAARMDAEERKALADSIRSGVLAGQLSTGSLDEVERERLATFMRRCGIPCAVSENNLVPDEDKEKKEVRVEIRNRNVWVSREIKEKLDSNMKRIEEINPEIQLRNAQRHIMVFNEEEEKVFASLQEEYLKLLKEQDELLRDFNEEEKLSVKA
jgi:hypothetical protein